jgi:hypothetical protein
MTQYEYPIALDCEMERVSVMGDLVLQRMDEETRQRLLKISNVQLNEEGRLKSFTQVNNVDLFMSPDVNRNAAFLSSNFVLIASNTAIANDFNFALKLLCRSWSALFIGYAQSTGSLAFCSPPCYFGKERVRLDETTVPVVQKLLKDIAARRDDEKLSLMREIWMYAMSDAPRNTSRFIEVSTLLEMLLLPKQSTELGFRFALRLAKLGTRLGYEDPAATFAEAKTLYAIRSKLVHAGKDERITTHAELAYEYARTLLVRYLSSPSEFSEDALDRLCIAA